MFNIVTSSRLTLKCEGFIATNTAQNCSQKQAAKGRQAETKLIYISREFPALQARTRAGREPAQHQWTSKVKVRSFFVSLWGREGHLTPLYLPLKRELLPHKSFNCHQLVPRKGCDFGYNNQLDRDGDRVDIIADTQLNQNTCFREFYTCFGCETTTGVVRILVNFQDRPMFGHIIQKVSARAFHWCGWT